MIKEGYTRVSEILSPWNDFSMIDPDVLENKRVIGVNVHAAIEGEKSGIFVPLEDKEQGYFDSYDEWKKSLGNEVVQEAAEQRFYCDSLMLTGCVDAVFSWGGEKVIVDYKTSASVNKKNWLIQGALYLYLARQVYEGVSDKVIFVHLKKDGKIAKNREFDITAEVMDLAVSAVKVYKHFKC